MIKNYRILVDGQYYTGEKEVELNTWHVDPWSKDSFQVKKQTRNVLTFESKENNNFKTIVGVTNLLGEVNKIIKFCNYTELMTGNEIVIEAEPYKVVFEDALRAERDQYKSMVERLIDCGEVMHMRSDGGYDRSEWDALVAECKEQMK